MYSPSRLRSPAALPERASADAGDADAPTPSDAASNGEGGRPLVSVMDALSAASRSSTAKPCASTSSSEPAPSAPSAPSAGGAGAGAGGASDGHAPGAGG